MSTTARRKATLDEILSDIAYAQRTGSKVLFKTPTVEVLSGNSKTGVAHKEWAKAKVKMIDGWPHVQFRGRTEPLVGDTIELDDGRTTTLVGIPGSGLGYDR